MLINAKERFQFKRVRDQGAEKLYVHYIEVVKGKPSWICEESIDYLKAFVQHSPRECIRIVRKHANDHFTLSAWGDEYLNLISLIAAYHLDRNEITKGLIWAKKSIDLLNYFAPTLKRELREEILCEMIGTSMICTYPKSFNQYASDHFFLAWEKDHSRYFANNIFCNDNHLS